ncbi:MAG TPA: PAS domain S-box protein, partial [Verrucomicrobiae bacterium]|nr:PAS domain S-box protein [Verrucomicrobiae bacterium]
MVAERRSSSGHPVWVRYGVALLSVAVALFVHYLLDLQLGVGEHLGFLAIYGAIAFSIWYGRWRPAAVAAIVGWLAANYLFFLKGHFISSDVKTIARLVGYVISCGIIITLGEMLHRTRERTEAEILERKQAQQAESRQKELLLTTLRSIGDGVVLTDEQGRVTFLNAEAERLTGWKNSEANGRPLPEIFRIVNEYTRKIVENPVEKVIRHGNVVGLANHTVLIAKDGREIPIDDSAAPIREQGGPLFGIVLVFRDFTERKKAYEITTHLAAVVEHSRDAIFTKNLNGIVQSWNASAERLFGYRADEMVGQPITKLFPPDRLMEEDHILGQLKEGRPVERFETVRIAKSGRQIPVSISISPLKDPEGNIIGASKIVHDITELVAAREALLREKELMATTLASIGDAVIVTDANGRVAFMNPEAERLTKWTTADAVDMPLPDVFRIINEKTRAAAENPVDKVLRLGSVVGLANHTVLIAKDGTEFPIDDSAAPIRQPGGSLFGVVLVFRDFTERKVAEDRLQELVARLESLVTYAPIAIELFDSDLKFVSANDRAAEINGLAKEAHIGKKPAEVLPHIGPQIEEHLRKVRDTGEPVLRTEVAGETPARP